ncbi:hypothetical protein [Limosilactobacillus reuteri]
MKTQVILLTDGKIMRIDQAKGAVHDFRLFKRILGSQDARINSFSNG